MFYKLVALTALITSSTVFAGSIGEWSKIKIDPNTVIKIDIGPTEDVTTNRYTPPRQRNSYVHEELRILRKENRRLSRRTVRLEEAVRQLQSYIYDLDHRRPQRVVTRSKSYTCYIKTPFDGTHYGSGNSTIAATAKALKKCEKVGSSWCDEDKIKCDAGTVVKKVH